MTTRFSQRALIWAAGGLAAFLIACGGDSDDTPDATGTTPSTPAATGSASPESEASPAANGSTASTTGASGTTTSSANTSGPGLFIPAGLTPETEGPTEGDGIFTPETNREIYQKISSDYQEIVALADVVNNGEPLPAPEILLLYEAGMHTRLGTSSRSLRGFAREATRATDFPEATEFYGSATFLDTPINDAIAGARTAEDYTDPQRRQAILKGLVRILYHWSLRYIRNAEETLNEGWVDEAWAIYVGERDDDGNYPNSLAAVALNREENFDRSGTIDRPMREAMVRAHAAAKADDAEAYKEAAQDIYSRFNAIFYLSTVRYLGQAVESTQSGNAETAGIQMVEGLSYYQSIQPQVAAADPDVDAAIVAFFTASPDDLTPELRDDVLEKLNALAEPLLLEDADLVTSFE